MRSTTASHTKGRAAARACLAALAALVLAAAPLVAQDGDETTGDRQGLRGTSPVKNYAPWPNPDHGYVTDLAGLLSRDEQERIEQWLWQVEEKTGVEIAVVTINRMADYPGTGTNTIEPFATGLFDAWGIGNMPENNGVLLLVSRDDRKARIELGAGYGRRRDGDANRIMQHEIIPRFRDDEYAEGITDGVRALMAEFADVHVKSGRFRWSWPLIVVLIAIPMVLFVMIDLFRKGKRGWGWVFAGLLVILLLLLWHLLKDVSKWAPRGRSSGWSSGGFGGGFGGGFSGGGGATGSW